MPTFDEVYSWISQNVLDTDVWDKSTKQDLAVKQAKRNLSRWYPTAVLTTEVVAYQAIWELQGLDPVLKYQKHGIRAISEGEDRIDYLSRDRVAPEVRELLGAPADEIVTLEGGYLL
jgi:hypothetical protein